MVNYQNPAYMTHPSDPRGHWLHDYRADMLYKERPRSMSEHRLHNRSPKYGKNVQLKIDQPKAKTETHSSRTNGEHHLIPYENSVGPTKDYSLCSYFTCCRNTNTNSGDPKKSRKYVKLLFTAIVLLLYIAFVTAALLIKSDIEDEDYWCRGDGFLIVLSAIIALFVVYFKIIKPILLKIFKVKSEPGEERRNGFRKFLSHRYIKWPLYLVAIIAAVGFLVYDSQEETERLFSLIGVLVFLGIGVLISSAPRKIKWESVIWGLGFQYIFGIVVLRWSTGRAFFACFSKKIAIFLLYTDEGSSFVFGDAVEKGVFAFKVLSVTIFFSMVVQILYYYGVMQWLVVKIGWLLQITIGSTACESINAAANIFIGQTEAPLLIKPYLGIMTHSELHAVMTGGFATIAGAVLAAFISFGINASHLMTASVMNAPAALAMSKLIYPETAVSQTKATSIKIEKPKEANVLHAAIEGISAAIPLVANIGANLLSFIAFVALIDGILNWACLLVNVEDGVCSLSNIFGYVFTPIAFVMGVPWIDCNRVGQLIGTKFFVNEFVAYVRLSDFVENSTLTTRGEIISTFALCGFGNIGSIGIQIGGLGAMAPERKGDLARIAIRAVIAGTFATFSTACVAGAMIPSGNDMTASANSTMINGTMI